MELHQGNQEQVITRILKKLKKKKEKEVYYVIVSEAGASVYSASELASKEYPDVNVSLRGAISIGRRLQDPMAELVKIDPNLLEWVNTNMMLHLERWIVH